MHELSHCKVLLKGNTLHSGRDRGTALQSKGFQLDVEHTVTIFTSFGREELHKGILGACVHLGITMNSFAVRAGAIWTFGHKRLRPLTVYSFCAKTSW